MKKLLLTLTFLTLIPFTSLSQSIDTDMVLQQGIEEVTRDFKGVAGVYVYNLKTRKEAGVNADTIFPTASNIKIPIILRLFERIDNGDLTLNDKFNYDEKRVYGGSGLMQFYKDSTEIDLRTLAALMITYSDNVASIWSQELAGGGIEINDLMERMGLKFTRVNSRTEGREDLWKKYGWGQTTPREMASILIKLRNRDVLSAEACDEIYRMMTNSFYTDYALSQIPPYIQTAAKQGMVNQSRSELVMVNAPGGDYVFYIATKNNEDTSWEYDNEAWELQRKISGYLWNYFEPYSDWKPAAGAGELVKGLKY